MVYGLTKGQASPTSMTGFKTPLQIDGVINEPFNPIAVAIALNASFVARAFSNDIEQTKEIVKKAVQHKGYALVDIFQPCITFNRVNTFQWYKNNTYYLDDSHNSADRGQAFAKAIQTDKYPLGIIYRQDGRHTFEEQMPAYLQDKTPLIERTIDAEKLNKLLMAIGR
jgi:2-oxoglutarate ferredoxin oxidoreductase subunit beta